MKKFFPVLHTAALFSGISDDDLAAMLSCLGARIDTFPKGSRLLRAGEAVEEVGLVLAGSALIVQENTSAIFSPRPDRGRPSRRCSPVRRGRCSM